jgi:isorenieratene synthase
LPAAPPQLPGAAWQQADPGWIRDALRMSQALPSGGWYVLDASDAFEAAPRRVDVAGRALVVWRAGDQLLAAPNACPHMGAPLEDARVYRGRLVCPWHGLSLGVAGHGEWRPFETFDDGVLSWVRLPHAGEVPTEAPYLTLRPRHALTSVLHVDVACDAPDVIANRLDPWHGTYLHPHAFARLRVVEQLPDEVTVRVAYRVLGPLAVEVDARFHCPDPRTIAMTIVRGDGAGSVVETHATPIGAGRTRVTEAVFATSDRAGFAFALRASWLLTPLLRRRSARLWREDAAYAERVCQLRHKPCVDDGKVIELHPRR